MSGLELAFAMVFLAGLVIGFLLGSWINGGRRYRTTFGDHDDQRRKY